MIQDQDQLQHVGEECPVGDENCPHFRELQKLREENQELAALVRTDELTGLFDFR